jgi:CRISPR-associated protein (TIGR03984 family)
MISIDREHTTVGFNRRSADILPTETDLIDDWLVSQGANGDILLAHADDGVIWGQIRDGNLFVSHQVAPQISPPLQHQTLQDLRLFNTERELRLWRVAHNTLHWTSIEDAPATEDRPVAFDEVHLLWGTKARVLENDFVLLEDGEQGLRHVIPAVTGLEDGDILLSQRLGLYVRHYVQEAPNGVNSIATSRLVALGVMNHGS